MLNGVPLRHDPPAGAALSWHAEMLAASLAASALTTPLIPPNSRIRRFWAVFQVVSGIPAADDHLSDGAQRIVRLG